MPQKQIDFSLGTPVSPEFLDRIQEINQAQADNCALSISGTSVTIAAATNEFAAAIVIGGKMRIMETPVSLSFVGAGSATYYVWATTTADDTLYTFALDRTTTTSPPGGAAFARRIGQVTWNGSALSNLVQTASYMAHAHMHRSGVDPLPSGSIGTSQIADGAITTDKIADGEVTAEKLAEGIASTIAIEDGAVTNPKLAANAVTSSKIADGTIVNADVSSSAAIAYSKLALTGGIVNADIAAGANISWSKLASAGALTMTQVTLGDGTAGSPAVNFTSDTNTGIFRVGTDQIGFSTGGTQQLAIDGSGNITQSAGQYRAPSGSATSPSYTFSSDTNTGFYRNAADLLSVTAGGVEKIQIGAGGMTIFADLSITGTMYIGAAGMLIMSGKAANAAILASNEVGDANWRLYVTDRGNFIWGGGATGGDVNIFRSAAGVLQFFLGYPDMLRGYKSPKCILRRNSFLSSSTGALTAIPWTSETMDSDGFHSGSNSYVTIPYDGAYAVTVSVKWDNVTGGTYRRLYIFKNSQGADEYGAASSHNLGNVRMNASATISCVPGDTIGAWIQQDGGAEIIDAFMSVVHVGR